MSNPEFLQRWLKQRLETDILKPYSQSQKLALSSLWKGIAWHNKLPEKTKNDILQLVNILGIESTRWLSDGDWRISKRHNDLKRILKKQNISTQDYIFDENWTDGQKSTLAKNLATPKEVLKGLFLFAENSRIIEKLAGHPSTPVSILQKIAAGDCIVSDTNPVKHIVEKRLFCTPSYSAYRQHLPYLLNTDCQRGGKLD